MKTFSTSALALIIALAMPLAVLAGANTGGFAEADKYYQRGEFNKALRLHLKLAKNGDHDSQHRVSQMYARGEGTGIDLTQAYAWAVLAADGGHDEAQEAKHDLLQLADDRSEALEQAEKLKKKYGDVALESRKERRSKRRSSGSCTGSRISC